MRYATAAGFSLNYARALDKAREADCLASPLISAFGSRGALETSGEGKEIENEKNPDCISDIRSMDRSNGQ